MAEVVEINDLETLESYSQAWNDLLPQTPRASFFHTYEWFVTFWNHYGKNRRMRVLVVRSGETVIGIVPLCVQIEPCRLSKLQVLTYPLSDWGMWYGPLGANQSTTMFMALQHLRSTPRDWDMIEFRWTSAGLNDYDATGRAMSAVSWKPARQIYQQTSLIQFTDSTWDQYFKSLDKKWRHEVRRQSRNLEYQGEVEFVRHRPQATACGDGDPRWDLFNECVEVSKSSWQAESCNGNTISHSHVLPFIRDCHAEAARLGMLDVTMLRVSGRPVAFQYNYHREGQVFGLRMGYARKARYWGVGKILLSRIIQDCFDRQDKVLDMGIGEFDFKSRFRTDIEKSYSYSYFPWTAWRSQTVRMSRWIRRKFVAKESKLPMKEFAAPGNDV